MPYGLILLANSAGVRKSILEANLAFKNSLEEHRDAVALYAPKASANILIPPVLRQFTLTVQIHPNGKISKSLLIWTPRVDMDSGRPIKATMACTFEQQS